MDGIPPEALRPAQPPGLPEGQSLPKVRPNTVSSKAVAGEQHVIGKLEYQNGILQNERVFLQF